MLFTPLFGLMLVCLISVPLNSVTLAFILVSTVLSANLLTGLIVVSLFRVGFGVGDPRDLKEDADFSPVEKDDDLTDWSENELLGASIVLNEVVALPVLLDDARA